MPNKGVEQPAADIEAALSSDATARAKFEALAPSHRSEYLAWISGAKKAETRARRITKMLEMLQR